MEKKFVDGLFFNKPRENAPSFIKGSVSFKVENFIKYLQENVNEKGYVNIDLKESREGKYYADLNDWKPEEANQQAINNPQEGQDTHPQHSPAEEDINVENIPF